MSLVQVRSAAFPGVFLRMDGRGITQWSGPGGGLVNCQFDAGKWETFDRIDNGDGTVSFRSIAFDNVFLRLDGTGVTSTLPAGGGVVNAQFGAKSYESFFVVQNVDSTQSLLSSAFSHVTLRMDATGITEPLGMGGGTVNAQFNVRTWEKLVVCDCINHAEVNGAIDQIKDLVTAQEAATIEANRADIVMACCPPYAGAEEAMARLQAIEVPAVLQSYDFEAEPTLSDACTQAIVNVGLDVVGLGLSLLGVRLRSAAWTKAMKTSIYNIAGALKSIIKELKEAEGALRKGFVLFKLFAQIVNATGLREMWKIIKSSMGFWDWVKTAVVAIAQITAWLATEGLAYVAQVVLLIPGLSSLLQNANQVYTEC